MKPEPTPIHPAIWRARVTELINDPGLQAWAASVIAFGLDTPEGWRELDPIIQGYPRPNLMPDQWLIDALTLVGWNDLLIPSTWIGRHDRVAPRTAGVTRQIESSR